MSLPSWSLSQILGQLDSGYHWTSPNLTYSFPNTSWGMFGIQGEKAGFRSFNSSQKALGSLAITLWDDLINPDFSLTTATGSSIEFGYTNTGIDYAHAYYPADGSEWFNSRESDLVNVTFGKSGFEAFIHETGHALGLSHMGDYDGDQTNGPSCFEDSTVYTVMSYYGPSRNDGQGQVAWADWTANNGVLYSAQTPMINDIYAIQSIYGAETTTRSGNTIYGFNSNVIGLQAKVYNFVNNPSPIVTIYDSGGIDTLDLSGWSSSSLISIEPGTFSSANSMTFNIGVAFNADIEIAIGGKGNDEIYGNSLRNDLYGGQGDDDIYGQGGTDLIFGEAGSDFIDGGAGDDDIIGGLGKDYLKGGSGSDYFYFKTRAEAGNGSLRDVVQDFQRGIDKIDLSDIDANTYLSGNQAFTYIGAYAFYGVRGQLRYAASVLSGDVNGDRIADFQIEVAGLGSVNDLVL